MIDRMPFEWCPLSAETVSSIEASTSSVVVARLAWLARRSSIVRVWWWTLRRRLRKLGMAAVHFFGKNLAPGLVAFKASENRHARIRRTIVRWGGFEKGSKNKRMGRLVQIPTCTGSEVSLRGCVILESVAVLWCVLCSQRRNGLC